MIVAKEGVLLNPGRTATVKTPVVDSAPVGGRGVQGTFDASFRATRPSRLAGFPFDGEFKSNGAG